MHLIEDPSDHCGTYCRSRVEYYATSLRLTYRENLFHFNVLFHHGPMGPIIGDKRVASPDSDPAVAGHSCAVGR